MDSNEKNKMKEKISHETRKKAFSLVWSQFFSLLKPFFRSSQGWKATGLILLLVLFCLSINGFNIVLSYVNRDLMTVLAEGKVQKFYLIALENAGVFVVITVFAVLFRFTEERLGIYWRQWLTQYFLKRYLSNHNYFGLNALADIDNPDQRISEDIRTFTSTTLSVFLIILNSMVAFVAFTSVLWSITPWLVYGAMIYALFGSSMAFFLGYKLVDLNFLQLKKEADLRYDLIQIREHADAIALGHGEHRELSRLNKRLLEVVKNFKWIIGVNRNLSFFTTGYNYWSQLIPVIIVAPYFLDGNREFGVVTQASSAFAFVLGSFSIIVTEFQRLSSLIAIVSRLSSLDEAMKISQIEKKGQEKNNISLKEENFFIGYENLNILGDENDSPLIVDLNVKISSGQRLLILGSNCSGKSLLIHATAGIWSKGSGTISVPSRENLLFLTQYPYYHRSTLRELLTYPLMKNNIKDDFLINILNTLSLDTLLKRMGGLDVEENWSSKLSASELQLLSVAQLLIFQPRFAFLDEAVNALGSDLRLKIYQALFDSSITYISTTNDPSLLPYHDSILELHRDGSWAQQSINKKAIPPSALS